MAKIENKTKWILSAIILTSILGYIFSSFGNSNAILWTFSILGFLIGIGTFTEIGIYDYFRQKKYKKVGFGDFLVWIGAFFGGTVIINSIFIIQSIRNVAPQWLLHFISINGAIAGGITGIFLLLMLWSSRPE